jgi:hypothetical protein
MPTSSRRLSDLIHLLGSDRLIPILENTGPGETIAIGQDDLKPEIVTRLSHFASAITVEAQNEYPVTNVPGKFGLQDSSGMPSGIRDPGENDQAHFTQNFSGPSSDGKSAEGEFNNTSHSGQLDVQDAARGGRFVIKKGKSNIAAPTATELYKDINDHGESSDFIKRVRQVQFDNNRFTLGKTYVPRTGLDLADGIPVKTPGSDGSTSVSEDESNIGVAYSQQEFGKHGPRKFPSAQGDTATLIKIRDLKKIGLLTMLQASGEYYIPQDPNDVAQQVAARGAALAPGLARVGQKIDISRVSPVKIMKDIDPNFQKPNLDDNIKREPVLSYGNVNNWMTPFSGLSSTASVACAALLTLSVGGLIKGAAQALAPLTPSNPIQPGANLPTSDRRKRLGSYLGKADEVSPFRNTDFDLQVTRTSHDYFLCVSRGIDIFFGLAAPGVEAVKVAQNHGYFNTVLRSLIRGTTDMIMMAAGGLVNTEGVRDVNDVTLLGNPLGSIELIQKLNSSQLLRFCNIMATIGDIALGHQEDGFLMDGDGATNELISDIDRIVAQADVGPNREASLNPAVLQGINRLPGQYRNAMAWGSNTAKSMYMVPKSLSQAEERYLGANDQSRNPSEAMMSDLRENNLHVVKDASTLSTNRISAEDVKAMEEHLEADYMPFYFHDLRTNEIISFHAFLEDMNDNFEADYTDVEGYGRSGAVHIYKNTKRSISLAFRVVATNHKDFDHMWYKINKLITLVYPQYTEGRQVGTSTDKFIQPFSQVPSASPMVRLRLGDLFKSNYSKFALARLFGVGSSQFALQGQQGTATRNASLQSNLDQVRTRMSTNGDYHVGEFAILTPLPAVRGRGSAQRMIGYPRLGDVTDSASQPGQTARNGRGGRTGAGIQAFVSVTGANSAGGRTVTSAQSPGGAPLVVGHAIRVQISRASESHGLKVYRFTVPGGGAGQDGIYACTQYDLSADPNEITRVAFNQSSSANSEAPPANTSDTVSTFFSTTGDNGNSIIKAFESTKGKGLAGFIKSIRFDWSDARWETGRHNARAPMSVKIAMEFAPIHDINPGLDSEGFMTSPVYNTGDTMKALRGMPEEVAQNNTDRLNMDRAVQASVSRSQNGVGNGGGGGVGNGG